MVSLGTGIHRPEEHVNFRRYGLLQWILNNRLIRATMEGSSTAVHTQMTQLLPKDSYYRIQIETSEEIQLDNVSHANIQQLKEYGKRCVEENTEEIDQICKRLQ